MKRKRKIMRKEDRLTVALEVVLIIIFCLIVFVAIPYMQGG